MANDTFKAMTTNTQDLADLAAFLEQSFEPPETESTNPEEAVSSTECKTEARVSNLPAKLQRTLAKEDPEMRAYLNSIETEKSPQQKR